MEENRIFFFGNPWPEGHPIKEFKWAAEVKNNQVWFHLHLKTKDYYSEREINEDIEYDSDWKAPGCWGNYHNCTISSTYWHKGGFPVCDKNQYSANFIDGKEFIIDTNPYDYDDEENLAFLVYLLGHDSVAYHNIKFQRRNNVNHFDIDWKGKIALTYAGDDEFKYDFQAKIFDIKFPEL